MFDTDIDVFRHHDCVVHHQSYREYDCQHGQYVDGKTGDVHDKEGTDQRYGDNHAGNQRNTPVAQEQEDDQYHQCQCHIDRFFHFGNGRADETGVIVNHFDRYIFRQVLFQLFDTVVSLVGNLDMIGTRLGHDYTDYHRFSVFTQDTAQVFRCQFCASDIFEADDIVGIFLNDQVIELFRCMHQTQGTDRQVDRISFDATGG